MTASRRNLLPASPAFAGMALDRASTLRRDPAWVAQRLEDPESRFIAAGRDSVVIEDHGPPRLLRRPLDRESVSGSPDGPILLGLENGAAVFAVDLERLDPAIRARWLDGGRIVTLREAGSLLSRPEGGLAA